MANLLSKLEVPEIPFEDENWEDPSIFGWMTFFLISLFFGALFTIGSIYHYSYYYTGVGSFILMLPAFYCLYSIVAFVKRWKNAIFLTKSYLIYLLTNNFLSILMGQFVFDSGLGTQSTIWSAILCILWLIWIFKSKRVNIRFPQEHRKAFIGDWIITIIILGGFTFLSLISIMVVS